MSNAEEWQWHGPTVSLAVHHLHSRRRRHRCIGEDVAAHQETIMVVTGPRSSSSENLAEVLTRSDGTTRRHCLRQS